MDASENRTFAAPTLTRFLWQNAGELGPYFGWRVVGAAATVPFPWITQMIVDHVVPADDYGGLWLWTSLSVTLLVVHMLTMRRAVRVIATTWQRIMVRMRARIFQKLQFMHFGFLDGTQTGKLLSKYAFDTQNIEGAVLPLVTGIIPELVRALLLIAVLSAMNPLLLLFILVAIPIFTWARFRYFRPMEHHNRQVRLARERLTGRANEFISAIKLVRGFGQEPEISNRMEEVSGSFADRRRDQMHVNQTLGWVMFAAFTAVNILAVAFAAFFVMRGRMTLGTLIALVGALPIILNPINMLTQFSMQFFIARESYQSIKELIDSRYVEGWRGERLPAPLPRRNPVRTRHVPLRRKR